MTDRFVIHDTFTIERTYPAATPSRVFAAFAPPDAKNVWGDTGGLEPAEGQAGIQEFDFRPGRSGAIRHHVREHNPALRRFVLRHRAGATDPLQLRDVRRRRQDLGLGRHDRAHGVGRRHSADLDRAGGLPGLSGGGVAAALQEPHPKDDVSQSWDLNALRAARERGNPSARCTPLARARRAGSTQRRPWRASFLQHSREADTSSRSRWRW
jgi:hypothetical protein